MCIRDRGSALAAFERAHGEAGLADLAVLHRRWPFFRGLLQNAEVALARSDLAVGRRYAALAGADGTRLAERVEAEHARTVRLLLRISGRAALLDGVPALQRSIALRAPYLDPLNELQVLLLGRLRGLPDNDPSRLELEPRRVIVGQAAKAPQQQDLELVERIQVRRAQRDRALEGRHAVEERGAAGDAKQEADRSGVLGLHVLGHADAVRTRQRGVAAAHRHVAPGEGDLGVLEQAAEERPAPVEPVS